MIHTLVAGLKTSASLPLLIATFWLAIPQLKAQNLPSEYRISDDGLMLIRGDQVPAGLYDPAVIRQVNIEFSQPDYWQQLQDNYESETPIPATLTFDGTVYDSVGVRFRGNTSYTMIGNSPKKSFAVEVDFVDEDQRVMEHKNLKFNNAHQDASFMKEVLYGRLARKYTPIAKANYIQLYINGEDWGLYPNIQSVDKDFLEDWFLSNDGARFRATTEDNGGGPGGGGWGDGTAGMNYLGPDTTEYQQYYDLKSSDIEGGWKKLVDACRVLEEASVNTMTETNGKLDIDKILWFLAAENIFADDDGYVMKGKMDYYVYYEPETDRTFAIEYDGNSSFLQQGAASWSPFKNASNDNYPLLERILSIPEWRQRYLAHYRTILHETLTADVVHPIIDSLHAQIEQRVAADTKKLYTTSQYTTSVNNLKNFVNLRRNFLLANNEITEEAPTIEQVTFYNTSLEPFTPPVELEDVYVTCRVSYSAQIAEVRLYYDDGLAGVFQTVQMADDGQHQDGVAGDGIYGATIPGFNAGTLVRYYIEAIAGNASLSASYAPPGAEHDVYIYNVQNNSVVSIGVVVNELVASNDTGQTDESGDNEDWIELFNLNDEAVDLSGFYMTDDSTELDKWQIPSGVIIPANGYLIIWADEEEEEGSTHGDFKLGAGGEEVFLSNPNLEVVERVVFPAQTTDVAYARIPNGTGEFVFQAPTFAGNNEFILSTGSDLSTHQIAISPNPFENECIIRQSGLPEALPVTIFDIVGKPQMKFTLSGTETHVNTSSLAPGMYMVMIGEEESGVVKIIKM